jgi:hypothetical protein
MKTQIYATYEKVEPGTENKRGLNLAVLTLTTAQVTKLPL